MKFVFLLSCLVVVFAHATSQSESADQIGDEQFEIPREPEVQVDDDGRFVLRLVDDDGTMYEEEGVVLTNEKTGEEVVIPKKGTYFYTSDDGKPARLGYNVEEHSHDDEQ